MSFGNLAGSNNDDLIGTDPKKPLGAQVAPSGISLPTSSDPGLAFPRVSLPQVNLPQKLLAQPELNLSKLSGAVTGKSGILESIKETQKTEGVKQDHTDPKVVTKPSQEKTTVSAPAQPQHISKEIAKVAPSVSKEVTDSFNVSLLSVAGASIGIISALIAALTNKGNALNDEAAQALSAGMAGLAQNVAATDNGKDFTENLLSSGLADAANQALAMTPLRQVAPGSRNPYNANVESRLASSTVVRAEWPNDGREPSPKKTIENKLKMTQDLFQAAGAQELIKDSCDDLATGAKLAEQSIGLAALGMQVNAMTKLGTIQQLNSDGSEVTSHNWRNEAELKRQAATNPTEPATSPKQLREALKKTSQNISGAFPGNLMHSAYADGEVPAQGAVGKAPASIAANMNCPFTSDISNFVNNPDPDLDSMAGSLASMYLSSNSAAQALYKSLLAFQKVVKSIISLSQQEVIELRNNQTKVGGDFVYFVEKIREDQEQLQPIDKLASNFTTNKMGYAQKDLIVELAGFWEQLDIDPNDFVVAGGLTRPRLGNSFLVSPSVFNIISNVAGPKESLDPSKTIAETVSAAVTPIDTMGGAIGPELAYAASNQAIMTRMVTVINSENTGSADNAIAARIKTMALAGAENASSMSFPGAHGSWFSAVSVSRDATPLGLFNAGLPASVSAVQSAIDTQQTKMAVLAEMKAQNRGGTTVVAGEAANDINHVQENTDTQNFVSGALKRQYDTIKTVLLKTITTISGTAKTLSDGQVVDALKQGVSGGSDFFNFSKNLVKEITNALASTTLSKVSGVKFEQQTEGRVQQAKFMLNQAGSSLSNEAPVIRNSARLNVVQAEMLVSESHASGYKSVWEHHIVDKAAGFATTDFYVNAKGKLTQTANKANYYGQAGTEIADKDHVTIDVGQGKAQVHATNTGITIQLGSASISLGTGGIININPLSAPSPVNVDIKFTQPQSFEAQPDNAASVLPAKGNRNPIPCASPYNDLNTVLPDLEK